MADQVKKRVLGQMLGQFVGQDVALLGHVTKIGAGGKTIELTTLDSVKINITMPEMIEATPTDILEVWGSVKTKGTMIASHYALFEEANCDGFDQKLYNDLIIVLHAIKNRKWKINGPRDALQ